MDTIKTKLLIPKIEVKEEPQLKYENLALNLDRNIINEPSEVNPYKERLTNLINFN